MTKRTRKIIEFLKVADKLKSVERRVHTASGRPENSAEHSWHLALAVWLLQDTVPFKLNLERALKTALVHDLVEIYAGDTFFFDQKAKRGQKKRERRAANRLFSQLPNPLAKELRELWRGYESGKTPEAKIVKALDKIMAVMQNIITDGSGWKKHRISYADLQTHKIPAVGKYIGTNSALWGILEELLAEAKRKKLLR